MDPMKTGDWVDLYSLVLDRLAEFLADPEKRAQQLGITQEELKAQERIARLPDKMDIDQYHDLRASWKRVAANIKVFGLTLGDDLMLAPLMQEMGTKEWRAAPWLDVARGNEEPLHFFGRDALTAIGFFNFFIQQCEQVDPAARIRRLLEAQGVNAENFRERMFGTNISNPWEAASPKP